jgi:hypothetical protein
MTFVFLVLGWVLPHQQVLRSSLWGPGSLKPGRSVGGGTNGDNWRVREVTAGSMAIAALMVCLTAHYLPTLT